jgi:hypothetical protein
MFDPPLTKDAGGSLELQVASAATDRSGGTKAMISTWNGRLLHSDTFDPGKDLPRRRYVKAVVAKSAPATIDAAVFDLALVELVDHHGSSAELFRRAATVPPGRKLRKARVMVH